MKKSIYKAIIALAIEADFAVKQPFTKAELASRETRELVVPGVVASIKRRIVTPKYTRLPILPTPEGLRFLGTRLCSKGASNLAETSHLWSITVKQQA